MLRDDITDFISALYKYLVGRDEYLPGLLVKKHSSNLQTHGDFSFPNSAKSWQEFLQCEQLQNLDCSLLKCINKDVTNLIETSQNWEISIVKAIELKDRIHLHVDRLKCIQACCQSVSYNNDYIIKRINVDTNVVTLDYSCKETNSITYLRLKVLRDVVKNLYLINFHPQNINILLTWRSKSEIKDSNIVFCGAVLNAKSGTKENTITADEYIRSNIFMNLTT